MADTPRGERLRNVRTVIASGATWGGTDWAQEDFLERSMPREAFRLLTCMRLSDLERVHFSLCKRLTQKCQPRAGRSKMAEE